MFQSGALAAIPIGGNAPDPASSGEDIRMGCHDGYSMTETTEEGSGWCFHTKNPGYCLRDMRRFMTMEEGAGKSKPSCSGWLYPEERRVMVCTRVRTGVFSYLESN
jgi:hypothetical protein